MTNVAFSINEMSEHCHEEVKSWTVLGWQLTSSGNAICTGPSLGRSFRLCTCFPLCPFLADSWKTVLFGSVVGKFLPVTNLGQWVCSALQTGLCRNYSPLLYSTKAATDNKEINELVCVLIQFHLINKIHTHTNQQAAGQTWPVGCSSLPHVLDPV